jgi:hypothetical protein
MSPIIIIQRITEIMHFLQMLVCIYGALALVDISIERLKNLKVILMVCFVLFNNLSHISED